jgi:hypothetical protein
MDFTCRAITKPMKHARHGDRRSACRSFVTRFGDDDDRCIRNHRTVQRAIERRNESTSTVTLTEGATVRSLRIRRLRPDLHEVRVERHARVVHVAQKQFGLSNRMAIVAGLEHSTLDDRRNEAPAWRRDATPPRSTENEEWTPSTRPSRTDPARPARRCDASALGRLGLPPGDPLPPPRPDQKPSVTWEDMAPTGQKLDPSNRPPTDPEPNAPAATRPKPPTPPPPRAGAAARPP